MDKADQILELMSTPMFQQCMENAQQTLDEIAYKIVMSTSDKPTDESR